jgi:hypothetical protein
MNQELKILDEYLVSFKQMVGIKQLRKMLDKLSGDEGSFFFAKIKELANRWEEMPKVYDQSNKKPGDNMAYLHYFQGSLDWWVIEKDCGYEQLQVFGVADLGDGPEFGYISLEELKELDVELDLFFKPQKIDELLKEGDPCNNCGMISDHEESCHERR